MSGPTRKKKPPRPQINVRGEPILWAAAQEMAKLEGLDFAEWVRRAVRVRMGWREVLDFPTEGPQ